MPSATLTFQAPINVSCQVGDTVYYVTTQASGGFTINNGDIIEIGQIREIQGATSNSPIIISDTDLGYSELNGLTDKFILFSKDNKANLSSPLGYFASVKMVNDNTSEAGELYSVGTEMFESSK
mgnify:CR=1 FL=1|tara:strand:+ start:253 stop:624 length:372 start_codon:yes stop_codon:yes gene_type:complete